MKRMDLKEKQVHLINMLQALVDFCEKNQINYFISSGTCLGAIRHQGFIPWDDDIDVLMLREDYEKFIKIYNDEKYTIHHRLNDKNHVYPFVKLYDESIFVQENNTKYSSFLFIDIFPLDYLSNDMKNNLKMIKKRDFYKNILAHKVTIKYDRKKFLHFFGKTFAFFFRIRWLVKKLDRIAIDYSNQKSAYCMDIVWGTKIVESRFFSSFKYATFEGVSVRIPAQGHEYLTALYGDYMVLPKEHERVAHDFIAYKIATKDE